VTAVAGALAAVGLTLAMVNPRQMRDYAELCGRLARTDRIGALILAAFAAAMRPRLRELPHKHTRALGDLLRRFPNLASSVVGRSRRWLACAPRPRQRQAFAPSR
jgi:transposase